MIRVQQMMYRTNVSKKSGWKQIMAKALDSRNPRLWWGQAAAGAFKAGPCPEGLYHSRPYCQALSVDALKIR
jgi:hypothetical protein